MIRTQEEIGSKGFLNELEVYIRAETPTVHPSQPL